MLKFLIEKEFKQMLRNALVPRMIVMMPVMTMLIMPLAANMEIKNMNVTVVDNDHSPYSARLRGKVEASPFFRVVASANSYERAMEQIHSGSSDLILEIPIGFEKKLLREGNPEVLISVNAVNGTKGGLGSAYMASTVQLFASELRQELSGVNPIATLAVTSLQGGKMIEVRPQARFNLEMDYKKFMVPALMVMLLTIMCGFMPALNIVSEKEAGTIEQINVTPVRKIDFILAKLIPYWLMGFVILTLCFGFAWAAYGLVPVGSLVTIYTGALIFVLAVSGLGLLISNNSSNMQQAMFVMFFFMIILILLSGLFTPVSSMPRWAQNITIFNPLKYFIQIMRQAYLKGSTLGELTLQLRALAAFAVVLNSLAILSYRKSG